MIRLVALEDFKRILTQNLGKLVFLVKRKEPLHTDSLVIAIFHPFAVAFLEGDHPDRARLADGVDTPHACVYTIKPNDSLWNIASTVYGNGGLYNELILTNILKYPSLKTSTLIYSGWQFAVPCR